MCRYFCIEFIDFMLAGKTLTEDTNLFSPNNFKKNDDVILNYVMSNIWKWMILIKYQIYPNLNAIPSNEQQFRLNKINEIKYYF